MGLENFLFLSGNGSVRVALLLVSVNLLDFTRGEVSSCPADSPASKHISVYDLIIIKRVCDCWLVFPSVSESAADPLRASG